MTFWLIDRLAARALLVLFALFSLTPTTRACPQGNVADDFAKRFAEKLTRKGKTSVVVDATFRCIKKGCGEYVAPVTRAFHSAFAATNLRVLSHEEQLAILKREGLLPIDLYVPSVSRLVAMTARADAYVLGHIENQNGQLKVRVFAKEPEFDKPIEHGEVLLPASAFTPEQENPMQDATGVYLAGTGGVNYVRCLKCPVPSYTSAAYDQKLQGIIIMLITVDAQGRPGSPRPVVTLPQGLQESALRAVQGWTFAPAMLNGKPVASRNSIEFSFKLH